MDGSFDTFGVMPNTMTAASGASRKQFIPLMTKAERAQLTQLEDVLATAHRWQTEAVKALVLIRDRKLYRLTHPSFEKYAQQKWGYERAYLYQLCQWGETIQNLSAFAGAVPERESHARPLYSLSPEDQRTVWKKVIAKNPTPATKDVEVVAREFRSPVCRQHTGALQYYGSKAALAPQIIAELPEHHCYVETHAGSAAVLLNKPPSEVEVINDIDDALVNWYAVLRDDRKELVRRLKLTPYARTEWESCRETCDDPDLDAVERARRYYVTICQSYSGTATSFSRSHTKPHAAYWRDRVERMDEVADRLRHAVIENMDAVELLKRYDERQTCFYVDPPYPHETRTTTSQAKYRHEMSNEQHVELLDAVNNVRGKVLVSGYECELYKKGLKGWRVCWRHRVACSSSTTLNKRNAHHRVEVLWANW
jgi:DNA adenine methylase